MQVQHTDTTIKNLALAHVDFLAVATGGVMLYTDDLTPDKSTVLGDLTAPTFAGYSRQGVSQGSMVRNPDGSWSQDLTPVTFSCSATPTGGSQTIHGFALVDNVSSPTAIIAAGRLDTPFVVSESGDGFSLVILNTAEQVDGNTIEISSSAVII